MSQLRAAGLVPGVIVALFLAACGDDTPNRPGDPAPDSLAINRSLWALTGFDSYSYRFRWECFCGDGMTRTVDVVVFRNELASVTDVETGTVLDETRLTRYRKMEGLFDFIAEARRQDPAEMRVAYDPVFGYPTEVYVDYVAGLADDEIGFRVYELSGLRQLSPRAAP